MDYMKILKRAWHILWHYPALWLIGFALALVGTSSGGSPSGQTFYQFNRNDHRNNNGFPSGMNGDWQQFIERINSFMDKTFGGITERTIITWAIVAAIVIFLLVILLTIIRYVALTAHIRIVNHLEESGEKVSWRKGIQWGWSKAAFRLWLIDLLVGIPTALVVLILFGCAAIPLLLGFTGSDVGTAAGVIATIGMGMIVFLVIFVAAFVLSLWMRFAYRLCVLENLGVVESLKQSWKLVRSSVKDILLMWLILVGVRIAFGIVMIPIGLIVVAIAVVIIGGFGLAIYASAAQISIVPVVIAFLMMVFFLGIPVTFVRGLAESFYESVWTLVYREVKLAQHVIEAPLVADTV